MPYINTIMWSVNVFGAIIFVFTENSSIRKLFYTVWIPGILYAYCVYMGSNQEFYAIASAGAAASVGSCAMIGLYFSELFHSEQKIHARKIALGIMCLVMVFQISSQVFYRYSWVFWDGEMKEMTTPITDGIEKGLYTTEENCKQYYQDLACMDLLAEYDSDVFLHLSEKTWYYLHMDSRVSTYSAWLSGVSETTLDRLDSYYQINPHKIPDLVLVDPGYENIAQQFCERYAYASLSTEFGTILTPQ